MEGNFCNFALLRFHHTEYGRPKPHMSPHYHSHVELYYVIDGSVDVIYKPRNVEEKKQITVSAREFVVIRSYVLHEIQSDDPGLKVFNLEVGSAHDDRPADEVLGSDDYVLSFPAARKLLDKWQDVLVFSDNQNVAQILMNFKAYPSLTDPLFEAAQLEIDFKRLFLATIRCTNLSATADVSNVNVYARKAVSFIIRNHGRDIGVEEVCAYAGISSTHLQRVFREAFDTTVKKYIESVRVDHAKKLLVDTNLSPAEIAAITGFGSMRVFASNFKRLTGMAPKEYRLDEAHKGIVFNDYRQSDKVIMMKGSRARRLIYDGKIIEADTNKTPV